jgi:pimeloyl-ACP methyl ester carboxylesterase
MLDHLKYAGSVAQENAEPVPDDEAGYPLLIFSHGWTGFKEQNSSQMEELASHGYVVASINHTYGAMMTVFPDGRVVPWNPEALPEDVPLEEYDIASNLLARQWAGDIAFTIEELKSNDLGAIVDFERIGVMGHSTGGGAALEFCRFHDSCDAVFAMDPWIEPASAAVRSDGIGQNAFFLFSENWELDTLERNYGYIEEFIRNSSGTITTATVAGTQHLDFSMLPLLSPLAETLGLKGPIDGDRIILIMNAMVVSYLDHVLKDSAAIPETLEGFPEVTFDTIPGRD